MVAALSRIERRAASDCGWLRFVLLSRCCVYRSLFGRDVDREARETVFVWRHEGGKKGEGGERGGGGRQRLVVYENRFRRRYTMCAHFCFETAAYLDVFSNFIFIFADSASSVYDTAYKTEAARHQPCEL